MTFKIAIIYFSVHGRLATLAHVIAEGAKKVPGAIVNVYRIRDPVNGDDPNRFSAAVLAAPVATRDVVLESDCIIIGGPGRQGGFAGEGKVGAAFTSVGGEGRGFGGHEVILQQFHASFLQHGMVVIGVPPQLAMDSQPGATPFGVVMAGRNRSKDGLSGLNEKEVKLAYSQGKWAAQITKQLHDTDAAVPSSRMQSIDKR